MQLIKERAGERGSLPAAVAPGKGSVIDHSRFAMHAVRLPARARIGKRRLQTIDHESIVSARPCSGHLRRPPTPFLAGHGELLVANFYFHGTGIRSPDFKYVHAIPPAIRSFLYGVEARNSAGHPGKRKNAIFQLDAGKQLTSPARPRRSQDRPG